VVDHSTEAAWVGLSTEVEVVLTEDLSTEAPSTEAAWVDRSTEVDLKALHNTEARSTEVDHNTVADHSTVMGWVDHSLVYSLDSTEDNTEAAHLDILAHILRWEDQNTDRFDDLSELHSC